MIVVRAQNMSNRGVVRQPNRYLSVGTRQVRLPHPPAGCTRLASTFSAQFICLRFLTEFNVIPDAFKVEYPPDYRLRPSRSIGAPLRDATFENGVPAIDP